MGLISASGINKPGFYAYEMLGKLGNELIQICVPKQTVFYVESIDELRIESCLSPHEVNFYVVTFEYS